MKKIFILMFLVCTFSLAANIGFKGIYLGANATKGCEILKNLSKSMPSEEYSEDKKEGICEVGSSNIKYKNNEIISMSFNKDFQDKIFNLSGLNLKERAQAFVNNLNWLSTLNYEDKYNANIGQNISTYSIRDLKKGFEFKIYEFQFYLGTVSSMELKKLETKKASF